MIQTSSSAPTAAVLVIGNEILSGRTIDANLNYIAKKLADVGIRLLEARVVTDVEADIVDAVNILRQKYTYVFTTGGIGPTHDDITADSMGKAFGCPVSENAQARARLFAHYKAENLLASRLRMARVPEGASLIDNPVSAAPGFRIENVYVMAGVPNIMQSMMDGIIATLKHGPSIHSRSISGFVPESTIAEELTAIAKNYPSLDIGSYPWVRNARWGTALVARGTDLEAIARASDEIYRLMSRHDPEATRD